MNKKERRLALATALQSAAEDVIVTESLEGMFSEIKTKPLVQALERWGVSQETNCLLITNGKNKIVYRSGRNIEKLVINSTEHINVYDILRADKIVIEKGALEYVQGFYGPNEEAA